MSKANGKRLLRTLPLPALVALAACQTAFDPAASDMRTESGAGLTLQPVTMEEIRGKLPPELGCSFVPTFGAPALLIGSGFVQGEEPSQAAIKMDGRVAVLTADVAGYEGLTAGPRFANGSGLSVAVKRGVEPLGGGFENQSWQASLVLDVSDGRKRTYLDGVWTCGP